MVSRTECNAVSASLLLNLMKNNFLIFFWPRIFPHFESRLNPKIRKFATCTTYIAAALLDTRKAVKQLLVFTVTPFKIDQNKNQNRLIDKVQNLGNERRYIYKDPRQDSGQRNISYKRYPKKCFTQTYRDLYGDAMLVLTWMSSNMADGNQQKHLLPSFATKAWIYSWRNS